MTQPTPAQQLLTVLQMDFRAADLGDTPEQFTTRMAYVVAQAEARATPVTPAQQEAGARYVLIGAQIRQTLRLVEEQKSASGSLQRQDLATKLAVLRLDQATQLSASELQIGGRPARIGSVSVPVEVSF